MQEPMTKPKLAAGQEAIPRREPKVGQEFPGRLQGGEAPFNPSLDKNPVLYKNPFRDNSLSLDKNPFKDKSLSVDTLPREIPSGTVVVFWLPQCLSYFRLRNIGAVSCDTSALAFLIVAAHLSKFPLICFSNLESIKTNETASTWKSRAPDNNWDVSNESLFNFRRRSISSREHD